MKTISEGTTSAARILRNVAEVPALRRTEPSTHLYQGKVYTPAAQMAIRIPVAQFSQPRGM